MELMGRAARRSTSRPPHRLPLPSSPARPPPRGGGGEGPQPLLNAEQVFFPEVVEELPARPPGALLLLGGGTLGGIGHRHVLDAAPVDQRAAPEAQGLQAKAALAQHLLHALALPLVPVGLDAAGSPGAD